MSEIKTGGPAFPCEIGCADKDWHQTGHHTLQQYGMSLRDYAAFKAMQGDWAAQLEKIGVWTPQKNFEERASLYYRMADAMLKARES